VTAPTSSPITIAVSGHRALHAGDRERARAQLSVLLAGIAAALPDRPLDCLSALADGADQLFAEQVLALQERLGADRVRLRVPLPMPEAAYIDSQEQPGSTLFRDSFLALRARAQDVFEVPADGGPLTGAAPYVRLADYVTAHADLLVALWDGDTLDVVMRYLATPGHAVLHVPVRRAGSRGAATYALPGLLTLDEAGGLQRG